VGGLYDALKDAGGEIFAVTNQEAAEAADLFLQTEGNDLEPAAAVAVASLVQAAKAGILDRNGVIMLNITGGGIEKFKSEHKINYLEPSIVFPLDPDPQLVMGKVKELF
jgi:cysteate synthase